MNIEMFNAIVDLVRDGGQAAIYVIAIHYAVTLFTYITGFGLLGYLISKVYNIIKYSIDHPASAKRGRME